MSYGQTSSGLSVRNVLLETSRKTLYLMLLMLLVSSTLGCGKRSGQASSLPTATALTEQAASLYRLAPGERTVYKLDYTNESASDLGALLGGQKSSGAKEQAQPSNLVQSFKTSVQGELTTTVLDKNAESILIAYTLRNPTVRLIANEKEAVTEAETIRIDLSRDIFAIVNLQGRVLSVRFDPAVGNLSQSFARSLIALAQFVFPNGQASGLHQWEIQEDDPNGQYIARYESGPSLTKGAAVDSQTDLRKFRKTKVRYLQARPKTTPSEIETPKTITPKGSLVASFDLKGGHLVSLSGMESQVIGISGKNVATAETNLQMSYLGKETLSAAELSAIRVANAQRENIALAVPLSVTRSKEESEALIHRNELGSATLESLLADLAKLEASAEEANETPLYLKFKALVYLHPESSATLGRVLASAKANSLTIRILTGALSAIGHREAQAAFVTAIRAHAQDWPALAMLIPALSQASSPTQLAEDTLHDLAFNSPNPDIASTAQLSLGSMARNLAETSPERTARIVEQFIKQIESSRYTDVTSQTLLVLGNAGAVQAFPTVARFMTDSSTALRAAAATALRWIESDQADVLLTKALGSDPDAGVRLEAAVALGFREMSEATLRAQKQALLKDKDEKVRLAVLNNLWKAHEAFPEVRRLVKQVAAKDVSKNVRKAAEEIVSR
jgi:HEAT repeats